MSEQQGPYRVDVMRAGTLSCESVHGPNGFRVVCGSLCEAGHYCDNLNAAYLAGQRSADAGLREALEQIAKQRTVKEWEEFAQGEGLDPDGADYTGAYDSIVRSARAALAKAKEGT